jgi:hypothetical protein
VKNLGKLDKRRHVKTTPAALERPPRECGFCTHIRRQFARAIRYMKGQKT